MLIADGVIPSNEGRGYVLRRIIRRALRYGRRLDLGIEGPFLAGLAEPVFHSFEGIHLHDPNGSLRKRTAETIRAEEEGFRRTMSVGADRVGEAISAARREGQTTLIGRRRLSPLRHVRRSPRARSKRLLPMKVSRWTARASKASSTRPASGARERRSSKDESGLPADDQIDPSWTTEFRGYPEQDFVSLDGREGARPAFREAGRERSIFLERGRGLGRYGPHRLLSGGRRTGGGPGQPSSWASETAPRRSSTRAALPTAGPLFTF